MAIAVTALLSLLLGYLCRSWEERRGLEKRIAELEGEIRDLQSRTPQIYPWMVTPNITYTKTWNDGTGNDPNPNIYSIGS